jgi:hypothetical protein
VQLTIDRVSISATDERAARHTLRAQIARLERELSGLVADGFPHIVDSPAGAAAGAAGRPAGAPSLLNLGQLERTRDELAGRLQQMRGAVARRAELERASSELLERMKRDPARYRFVRVPVRDLGEGGCGVWEVRPRLGLIGMLAGWWQVKLSSGCPLPGGRAQRGPCVATVLRGMAVLLGMGVAASADPAQKARERLALAFGHRADRLLLGDRHLRQAFATAGLAPPALAHQQVGDGHAVGLPGAADEHIGDIDIPQRDRALELGTREAHPVGAF